MKELKKVCVELHCTCNLRKSIRYTSHKIRNATPFRTKVVNIDNVFSQRNRNRRPGEDEGSHSGDKQNKVRLKIPQRILEIHGCGYENPCTNGATCRDTANGYFCSCPKGFAGKHYIDDCGYINPFIKCKITGLNDYTIPSTTSDVSPTTQVSFTCLPGYKLPNGDSGQRECRLGGEWNSPLPACEGQLIKPTVLWLTFVQISSID
ncbi:NOTCH1 [Mytilus edulis]|uniref:NOTCH1 n=1 Tax=Mytilus edulis TaxID=6550 RepID=A0A8S3SUJ8_MYTED|nr:NOTCH1 [Mytilus edulis]